MRNRGRHRLRRLCNDRPVGPPAAAQSVQRRHFDDGGPIRTRQPLAAPFSVAPYSPPAPAPAAVHRVPPAPEEWGWPPAEPSSLSWPQSAPLTIDAPAPQVPAVEAERVPAPPVTPKPLPALDDEEADADLAAIGGGKTAPAAMPAPPAEAAPVPEPAEAPTPPVDRHAIFGQLGRSMPNATQFNLGRFDLDRQLDMIEEGMSWTPPSAQMEAPKADMDDLDLLGEVAALAEAAGIPLRAAERPEEFLSKAAQVAEAKSLSLAELEEQHQPEPEPDEPEEPEQEEPSQESSPWSAASDDEEPEQPALTENQDG